MYTLKDFRKDILVCINLCMKEISNRKDGIKGEATLEQLKCYILPELNKLLKAVDEGIFPPQYDRYLLSFANAFTTWCWNMRQPTELYTQLVKLNNNYKEID